MECPSDKFLFIDIPQSFIVWTNTKLDVLNYRIRLIMIATAIYTVKNSHQGKRLFVRLLFCVYDSCLAVRGQVQIDLLITQLLLLQCFFRLDVILKSWDLENPGHFLESVVIIKPHLQCLLVIIIFCRGRGII